MPRIPRVTPAETALGRIIRSLGPAVEADDGGVRVEDPVPPPPVEPTNAEVRAWAAANKVEVSASGPIPKAVREAYDAAHQG